MVKGWRNDPLWLAEKRVREDRYFERVMQRLELLMMKHKLQMDKDHAEKRRIHENLTRGSK